MNNKKDTQESTETKTGPVTETAQKGIESGPEKISDVANWALTAPADRLKLLDTAKSSARTKAEKAPNIWYLDNSLTPSNLYIYLKARFGDPNGFSMMLKDPAMGSDNLIHWHHSFLCSGRVIDI